jgi:hypothetical protein
VSSLTPENSYDEEGAIITHGAGRHGQHG